MYTSLTTTVISRRSVLSVYRPHISTHVKWLFEVTSRNTPFCLGYNSDVPDISDVLNCGSTDLNSNLSLVEKPTRYMDGTGKAVSLY